MLYAYVLQLKVLCVLGLCVGCVDAWLGCL